MQIRGTHVAWASRPCIGAWRSLARLLRAGETPTPRFLLIALLICSAVHAQQNNPGSLFARDSTEGVYVRDSAVAAEKMALAYRLEHLKEWNKAADVYQELLQQYADRVTPSDARDQRIYQYTSVAIAVQQKLAKWPQEGLDAY